MCLLAVLYIKKKNTERRPMLCADYMRAQHSLSICSTCVYLSWFLFIPSYGKEWIRYQMIGSVGVSLIERLNLFNSIKSFYYIQTDDKIHLVTIVVRLLTVFDIMRMRLFQKRRCYSILQLSFQMKFILNFARTPTRFGATSFANKHLTIRIFYSLA